MKKRSSTKLAPLYLAWALALAHGAVSAQTSAPLLLGDEIRVSWRTWSSATSLPTRSTTYLEFVRMDERRLVGRYRDGLVAIDAGSIRTLQRRIGTKPASAPAMVLGSGAGFALGFLAGALAAAGDDDRGAMSPTDRGLSTGVLLGAPLGALVAWVSSRSRGIYEDVPVGRMRPTAAVAPSGQVRVSLSVAAR